MIQMPNKSRDNLLLKGGIIALLMVLMLIPISMIMSMIEERASNKTTVIREVQNKWGGSQQVMGPILVLPYEKIDYYEVVENKQKVIKKRIVESDMVYISPNMYVVDGTLKSEERAISIYKTLLYQSDLKLRGSFSIPDIASLGLEDKDILWNQACIVMGITHMQGLSNKVTINIEGQSIDAIGGVPNNPNIYSGVTFPFKIDAPKKDKSYDFDCSLSLNGSEDFYIVPIGKENQIHLQSDWNTVSFSGDFLAQERNINDNGFDATWNIYDYNRNFQQVWKGANSSETPQLGVSFLFPVEQYQMTMRAAKYAIMFIGLTFVVFFFVEVITRRRIHPIQYLLVAIGLVVFYTLLIALSEHINFAIAYAVSAIAIIGLITGYCRSIFKKTSYTLAMGIFLSILYIYLYVMLQLETMALLIGSIGLFLVLAIVMYASRKVDWYNIKGGKSEDVTESENEAHNGWD